MNMIHVNDYEFVCKDTIIDLYQCPFIVILWEQIVKTASFTAVYPLFYG